MSKHTPGPWTIRRSGTNKPYQIETTDGVGVTQWRGISRPASEEGEANANLIAAAPDLLEALELALSALAHCKADIGYSSLQSKAARKANAAIAKARGEA